MAMVSIENAPGYYKKTNPYYHSFFKDVFEHMGFAKTKAAVEERKTISDVPFLDSVYLHEATTFLRRSIFNLLAYKLLVCGRHLPMSKVALYYSYFDSISCLLRICGVALVHISDLPEKHGDAPVRLKFSVRQNERHMFSLGPGGKNEHQFVWNEFHKIFRDLSSETSGRLFTEDRYDWNYGLSYPSQLTEEHLQREIRDRCENNFIHPEFENASTLEEGEYKGDLVADFGHEEMYAGDLIQECLKLLLSIGKESEHRNAYVAIFKRMNNDIDFLKSERATKDVIKNWVDSAARQI